MFQVHGALLILSRKNISSEETSCWPPSRFSRRSGGFPFSSRPRNLTACPKFSTSPPEGRAQEAEPSMAIGLRPSGPTPPKAFWLHRLWEGSSAIPSTLRPYPQLAHGSTLKLAKKRLREIWFTMSTLAARNCCLWRTRDHQNLKMFKFLHLAVGILRSTGSSRTFLSRIRMRVGWKKIISTL